MNITWIDIPTVHDPRGNLAILEHGGLPFDFKRVFYLFDVPSGSSRGGHALQTTDQLLIPISGSFEVVLKNGVDTKKVVLNNPSKGLLISTITWRELHHFSAGAVCLALASKKYDEGDYIRDWNDFISATSQP